MNLQVAETITLSLVFLQNKSVILPNKFEYFLFKQICPENDPAVLISELK